MNSNLYHYKANLTRVIDGDTIVCELDLGCGVFLKEVHIQLRDITAEQMAQAPKEYIEQLLEGKELVIRTDRTDERDSFKRLLGKVYADGEYVNEQMVKLGQAEWL